MNCLPYIASSKNCLKKHNFLTQLRLTYALWKNDQKKIRDYIFVSGLAVNLNAKLESIHSEVFSINGMPLRCQWVSCFFLKNRDLSKSELCISVSWHKQISDFLRTSKKRVVAHQARKGIHESWVKTDWVQMEEIQDHCNSPWGYKAHKLFYQWMVKEEQR